MVAGGAEHSRAAGAGLPDAGTRFFGDLPDFADLPVTAQTARLEWRRSWVEQALAATRAPSAFPGNIVDQGTPYEGVERSTILEPSSPGAPYVRN